MSTREEIFNKAVAALAKGNKLLAQGVKDPHPDYDAMMQALHAAAAAGIPQSEIYAAATSPK